MIVGIDRNSFCCRPLDSCVSGPTEVKLNIALLDLLSKLKNLSIPGSNMEKLWKLSVKSISVNSRVSNNIPRPRHPSPPQSPDVPRGLPRPSAPWYPKHPRRGPVCQQPGSYHLDATSCTDSLGTFGTSHAGSLDRCFEAWQQCNQVTNCLWLAWWVMRQL